jgi:prepilin-type N-terminal cleavage/methylation domain-containing protein
MHRIRPVHQVGTPREANAPATGRRRARAGMTLVELLVVMAIMVILVASALPLLQPALEERRLRETARQVNTYFATAQIRAATVGRPVGVYIERMPNESGMSLQMSTAEIPPPFAGTLLDSSAVVTPKTNNPVVGTLTFPDGDDATVVEKLVSNGDWIRFGYAGPLYGIAVTPGTPPTYEVAAETAPGVYAPLPVSSTNRHPFQIYRKPQRLATSQLQLPKSTAIDLYNSGVGPAGIFPNDGWPIVLMFGPGGDIDSIYYSNGPQKVTGSVYLLVGGTEKLGSENREYGRNMWVTIHHRTGLVKSVENYGSNGGDVKSARQYAIRGESAGGS